jgi:hypothetical protein
MKELTMNTEHNELDRAIRLLNVAILIGLAIMVATYFIVV